MHLFDKVPTEPQSYEAWRGNLTVDGIAYERGQVSVYIDCNLTGEPMVFDDVNSRYALKARAITAQQVDGFHL